VRRLSNPSSLAAAVLASLLAAVMAQEITLGLKHLAAAQAAQGCWTRDRRFLWGPRRSRGSAVGP